MNKFKRMRIGKEDKNALFEKFNQVKRNIDEKKT